MSTVSQNPSPNSPSRRDDLILMLLHGGAASPEIAERVVDTYRAEVIAEAVEAARGEYLEENTGAPEDEVYNEAVSDVVAAIGALSEGGAR